MDKNKRVQANEEFGVEFGDLNAIKFYDLTYKQEQKEKHQEKNKEKKANT
ncbi:hypothetical protein M3685_03800 [Heyndrickxia oleronia]|nr:hypothetical protein [Heyndrickxia oleronia]NYV67315.1 hypothetical protein [Bacillus sp. Gen3]MBU5214455.1 hypothetical protein [Heyndrickxia oleronia]MCM3453053.1 hypothetical protein [Heyndrickxia oleronia]MEC1372838.1 hypothetical protein [Heyndrickxia oleronia]QQZ03433.1 hypothetical protein I5818_16935 [Heyndrickxia oleronia]